MKSKRINIESILAWLTLLACFTDAILFFTLHAALARVGQAKFAESYNSTSRIVTSSPPPSGYDVGANLVTLHGGKNGNWAVRYTSDGCHFCDLDEASWRELENLLLSSNFEVATVVPSIGDASEKQARQSPEVPQYVLLNLDWLKTFRLSKTPTVIIFRQGKGVVWRHVGTLSKSDLAYARSVIKD